MSTALKQVNTVATREVLEGGGGGYIPSGRRGKGKAKLSLSSRIAIGLQVYQEKSKEKYLLLIRVETFSEVTCT